MLICSIYGLKRASVNVRRDSVSDSVVIVSAVFVSRNYGVRERDAYSLCRVVQTTFCDKVSIFVFVLKS